MSNDYVDTAELRILVQEGAVNRVCAIPVPKGWALEATGRSGRRMMLRTQRGGPGGQRLFKRLEAMARFAKADLGAERLEIDMRTWEPGQPKIL